jgi:hypothetical protein
MPWETIITTILIQHKDAGLLGEMAERFLREKSGGKLGVSVTLLIPTSPLKI